MIIGNLTRDPEMKVLPTGAKVTNISVATNRVWKNKEGEKKEEVEFHNVVVFGVQAEYTNQYLKKGQKVYIEGRIQTQSWEKDGVKKYRTQIISESIQFGPQSARTNPDGAKDEQDGIDDVPKNKTPINDSRGSQHVQTPSGIEYPVEEINPDDIPF